MGGTLSRDSFRDSTTKTTPETSMKQLPGVAFPRVDYIPLRNGVRDVLIYGHKPMSAFACQRTTTIWVYKSTITSPIQSVIHVGGILRDIELQTVKPHLPPPLAKHIRIVGKMATTGFVFLSGLHPPSITASGSFAEAGFGDAFSCVTGQEPTRHCLPGLVGDGLAPRTLRLPLLP